jgi:hypothetical protein
MNVTILGCGPAGLMAAHGAAAAGATDLTIISKRRKSELFGAQYLHEPIPGIDVSDPVWVQYVLEGDPIDYRHKVYGQQWDGTTSPEDLSHEHHAWDIRQTYDALWDLYGGLVHDAELSAGIVANLAESADVMISSVPRPVLCPRGHTFGSQEIVAAGDAPSRGIKVPYKCPPNTVLCNGMHDVSWYRMSNIFDHMTVEWSMASLRMMPPVTTATTVHKPLFHNCDCLPSVHHVGRYGRWEKGVLSHTAFSDAYGVVERSLAGLSA